MFLDAAVFHRSHRLDSSIYLGSEPSNHYIKKMAGDRVFLGMINKAKAIDVRVDAVGGVTM